LASRPAVSGSPGLSAYVPTSEPQNIANGFPDYSVNQFILNTLPHESNNPSATIPLDQLRSGLHFVPICDWSLMRS